MDSNDSLVGPDSKATLSCLYSYFKLIPRCDVWCQEKDALSNKYMQKTEKLAGGLQSSVTENPYQSSCKEKVILDLKVLGKFPLRPSFRICHCLYCIIFIIVLVIQDVVTKYQDLGGLNNRHLFSHNSGGWQSNIRVPAWSDSESLSSWLANGCPLCPHMDCREREISLIKATKSTGLRLHHHDLI